jgi:outer membrane protein OmpA-like peptidoglycan-associated protein
MAYLKYALGPYGIAIAAAEVAYMAASQAGGIRLEPVKFTPGTTEIAPADQGYVEKLATILKDRPDARIRVCGLAAQVADQAAILPQGSGAAPEKDTTSTPATEEKTSADEAEEESYASTSAAAGSTIAQLPPEQLEALAKARSMAIKDFLVEQHGIKDDRILLCHPEIDKTSEGKPRAEILF